MVRLLAIVPLGFALLFTGTSIDVWSRFVHPQYANERLLAFGVAWLQTIGAVGCWAGTFWVAMAGWRERPGR